MDSDDFIRVAVPGQPGAYQMVHRDEARGRPREHPASPPFAAGCPYFGEPNGERVSCASCKGNVEIKLHHCGLFGKCSPGKELPGIKSCMGCSRRIEPDKVTTLKFPVVFRGDRSYRNSAIFEDKGRLRMLLRTGWESAGLAVLDIGENLQPFGHPLPLWARHSVAPGAQEDPRVFWFRNRLHVAFCGIRGAGREMVVSVLYARLNEFGTAVEEVFAPHYPERTHWEKNWSFFEHDRKLFAVYAIAPHHRILEIQDEVAQVHSQMEWHPFWKNGTMRGGASPVLVGDEYWSFFHGAEEFPGRHPKRVYTMGVYTFEAKPPFQPRRCTPYPILIPNEEDRNGLDISVVFPCGAVKQGDRWLVSYGYHDREVRIAEFEHHAIEKALR